MKVQNTPVFRLIIKILVGFACINAAAAFKIFGFDLNKLRLPPPKKPSYRPPPPLAAAAPQQPSQQQPPASFNQEPLPQSNLHYNPQDNWWLSQTQQQQQQSAEYYGDQRRRRTDYSGQPAAAADYYSGDQQKDYFDYEQQKQSEDYFDRSQSYIPPQPQFNEVPYYEKTVTTLRPRYVPSQSYQAPPTSRGVYRSKESDDFETIPVQSDYEYQEIEIITAPTVKSKASVYGGQSSFEVKVGAGFHTKSKR